MKEHADVERLVERWAADGLSAEELASSTAAAEHLSDARLLRLLATRPPDMTEEEAQQVLTRLRSAVRAAPERKRLLSLRWAMLVATTCLLLILVSSYRQSWPELVRRPAPQVVVKATSFQSVQNGRTVKFRLLLYKTQEPAHVPQTPLSNTP